jgi:hypothetical protein
MKKSQAAMAAVLDMEAEGMDVGDLSPVFGDSLGLLMEGSKEKVLRFQDENYSAEMADSADMVDAEAEIDEMLGMYELGLGY